MMGKRLLGRIFSSSIWWPGKRVMRALSLPGQTAVVVVTLILPAAWLLYGYWAPRQAELARVERERDGVVQARAALAAMEAVYAWQRQGGAPIEWQSRLKVMQQRQDAPMQSDARWHAVTEAAESAARATEPKSMLQESDALLEALVQYIGGIADRSGLAEDAVSSHAYLVRATFNRWPTVLLGSARLQQHLAHALVDESGWRKLVAITDYERRRTQQIFAQLQRMPTPWAGALQSDALVGVGGWLGGLEAGVPADGAVAEAARTGEPLVLEQFKQMLRNLELLDGGLTAREKELTGSVRLAMAVTALGVLLTIYFATSFYLSMRGGLQVLRRHMMTLSMGDLRTGMNIRGQDEISDLMRELCRMQQSLQDTVRMVLNSSNEVVHASVEIESGTRDLSARVESAAAALEQSSAALEQSTATTEHTADSVSKASRLALNSADVAQRGGTVVREVVDTMERIQGSSRRISDIIGVIDGIAFQTNILALNAAVEAARAGEQGRGFAVVAAEVRALAQRSATAAREIKDLITASVQEVDHGVQVVRGAGEAMQEIVGNTDEVRRLMDEVARAAREQSQGISQIGLAIQELDQNTQANAALVEETATAANHQLTAAIRMAAMVDEFRVPDMPTVPSRVDGLDVDTYIDAHRQWKVKLREAIEARASVDTATLRRDDCCALGKWIYGSGQQRFGASGSFTELLARHRTFHEMAGSVGEMINGQRYREAEDALTPGTPFTDATREVVRVLSTVKRLGF